MAIMEEFVVVTIYIALGFLVSKLDASTSGLIAGRQWKNKKNKSQRQNRREET